jgi:hypothetical protein
VSYHSFNILIKNVIRAPHIGVTLNHEKIVNLDVKCRSTLLCIG